MFVIEYFFDSLKLKSILKSEEKSLFKLSIFFIILILISNFPASYEVVKNEGSRLDFIVESFDKGVPLDWELPTDLVIKGGKLVSNSEDVYLFIHDGINYIFNNKEKVDPKTNHNSLIFSENTIIYVDNEGNVLEGIGYEGFSKDEFRLNDINLATGEEKISLYKEFASSTEKSFKKDIILYTLLRNNIIQISVNIIYALILALLVQLFRFGYQNFLNFKDGLKFVMMCFGVPAILTFIVGLMSTPFAPVVFQLSSGMIVMLVLLTQGKKILA